MRRYYSCIGREILIQGIEGGSLLLLLVLAVKNEGRVSCYEKGIVPKERQNP